ncbi:TPA: hydrolase TatD [Candidatus Gastranaerophilales bacterium HUM_6]|nr:MAG TPA: hydrolase TatD [Candidatus Gastranaerophilales bacterium HUM_6]DAA94558.1 MAG TPA: hydrolase TatD [Candidatus Gastranaerophilales bacterium HUM_7]DAB05842.1 MAG TPA: hydrolase TatD [Candidatus Gastranaerophilales bacterium HUM_14]
MVNTHSHVNTLKELNIDEVLKNAQNENIITIVPSTSTEDIFEVDKFVQDHDDVYGYVGIFPEEAKTFTDKTLTDMEEIIRNNKKIVGIGEVGLDYYWDKSFKELQKEIFIKQIEFANQMNLPLNIHSREAHLDTLEILKKYNKNSTAILHCYSGSSEFAKVCVKEGIYIALGGVVTFKNAFKTKEVAQTVPLEYLLLETDDPYLAPVPFRGKENQPMYVKYVAEEIAKLRGITADEVEKITTQNALKIFDMI